MMKSTLGTEEEGRVGREEWIRRLGRRRLHHGHGVAKALQILLKARICVLEHPRAQFSLCTREEWGVEE